MTPIAITPETFPKLEPLFQRYFEDMRYRGNLDMVSASAFWSMMLKSGYAEIWSMWDGDKPVAVIATAFLPDYINTEMNANVMLWYVMPEARRRGLGSSLMELAEKSARERGCAELIHGHRFTVEPDGGRRLLEPKGFEVYELQFRKVLA